MFSAVYFAEGSSYGAGIYFARDASYAIQKPLCAADGRGFKYTLLCRVVIGDYTNGFLEFTAPSRKPGRLEWFDSLVDNKSDPMKFVVIKEIAAYPEYVIQFV